MRKKLPIILSITASVGTVLTAISAVAATPKAMKLLNEAEKEKGEQLTKIEKARVTVPVYIPTTILGVASIACIFGASVLNRKQQASMASAYALLNQSYKDYRRKLIALYGEETDRKVKEAIAVEKANDTYIIAPNMITNNCQLPEGCSGEKKLFYEEISKRFFEASMEQVIAAEYHLNRNYILRGDAVLNEFYDFLGLEHTEFGDAAGWVPVDDGMYWIDFNHSLGHMRDGTPFYIIQMPFEPVPNYLELY